MRKHLVFFVLSFVLSLSSLPALAQSTCVVDCLADTGEGSDLRGDLRYCITNAISGEDTITFEVTGTINLTGRLPDLSVSVTIEGPGANLLAVRPIGEGFTVGRGATVLISGLTITGARSGREGGAIFNEGTLAVTKSTISDNTAFAIVCGGCGFWGGGILNHGTLTVTDTTIARNIVSCDDDGITKYGCIAFGGGIGNRGTLTVSNSTISGNTADGGSRGSGGGGGILNSGSLTVTNSTISGNSANVGGGVSTFVGGDVGGDMRNTILAGNVADVVGPDLSGRLTSSGYNLVGNSRGGSGYDESDLLDINPLLGPLEDNGGPTFTHAVLPGSPAIDAGDNTDAPEWDQRGPGFPRVVNGRIDIGAFEVQ
jgi:hypothetical protein